SCDHDAGELRVALEVVERDGPRAQLGWARAGVGEVLAVAAGGGGGEGPLPPAGAQRPPGERPERVAAPGARWREADERVTRGRLGRGVVEQRAGGVTEV